MKHNVSRRRAAVVGCCIGLASSVVVVTLLVTGGLESASGSPGAGRPAAPANVAAVAPVVYARNVIGLTYGSALDAASPAQLPDLISAIATNRKQGYVKKTDLYPPGPSNPKQALQRQRASEGSASRTIPVYAVDGRTVIGYFTIQPGGPTS